MRLKITEENDQTSWQTEIFCSGISQEQEYQMKNQLQRGMSSYASPFCNSYVQSPVRTLVVRSEPKTIGC